MIGIFSLLTIADQLMAYIRTDGWSVHGPKATEPKGRGAPAYPRGVQNSQQEHDEHANTSQSQSPRIPRVKPKTASATPKETMSARESRSGANLDCFWEAPFSRELSPYPGGHPYQSILLKSLHNLQKAEGKDETQ